MTTQSPTQHTDPGETVGARQEAVIPAEDLGRIAAMISAALDDVARPAAQRNGTVDIWKWLLGAAMTGLVAIFGMLSATDRARVTQLEDSNRRQVEIHSEITRQIATITANQLAVMQTLRDSSAKLDRLLQLDARGGK